MVSHVCEPVQLPHVFMPSGDFEEHEPPTGFAFLLNIVLNDKANTKNATINIANRMSLKISILVDLYRFTLCEARLLVNPILLSLSILYSLNRPTMFHR